MPCVTEDEAATCERLKKQVETALDGSAYEYAPDLVLDRGVLFHDTRVVGAAVKGQIRGMYAWLAESRRKRGE